MITYAFVSFNAFIFLFRLWVALLTETRYSALRIYIIIIIIEQNVTEWPLCYIPTRK